MASHGITITWLGHSAFRLVPARGPAFLFDPWLGNPMAPSDAADIVADARTIVLTHRHVDHAGEAVALAMRLGATVLAQVEVANHLVSGGLPADQAVGFNIGGATRANGLTVTLVQAMHSSSQDTADGPVGQVGTACGAVVEPEGGPVIYNTGDTGVFGDMALIAELYCPAILFLPIGDFYTMGARQAAKAVELVQPEWIVPQHYATFPGLPGTIEDFIAALAPRFRDRVLRLTPGEGVSP
jgi:L-ascorbate metabolism protein UlaG (beta-lactamase superfamily)